MTRRFILIILIIFIFLSSFFVGHLLCKEKLVWLPPNSQTYSPSEKVILGLLGEFRHTFACYLWIKADFYHHEYPGDWRTDKEIMPLIKLVTLLDPHFAPAYSFGGYHLAINLGKPQEGLAYLKEGVKNNPDDFDLNWTLSFVYWKKFKDYRNSLFYGKRALELAESPIGKLNSFRMIVNSYENSEKYLEALKTLNQMGDFVSREKSFKKKTQIDVIKMRINRIKARIKNNS